MIHFSAQPKGHQNWPWNSRKCPQYRKINFKSWFRNFQLLLFLFWQRNLSPEFGNWFFCIIFFLPNKKMKFLPDSCLAFRSAWVMKCSCSIGSQFLSSYRFCRAVNLDWISFSFCRFSLSVDEYELLSMPSIFSEFSRQLLKNWLKFEELGRCERSLMSVVPSARASRTPTFTAKIIYQINGFYENTISTFRHFYTRTYFKVHVVCTERISEAILERWANSPRNGSNTTILK